LSGTSPFPRVESLANEWHRYLYIPLGGSSKIWTTLVVFSFVALWHDLSLKLLTWGWVISLFVLPEMAAKKFVPYSIVRPLPVSLALN
jgi:D-alanyl-lipoteichoic acid acyltransferase DltB (MBOAT superfamily)